MALQETWLADGAINELEGMSIENPQTGPLQTSLKRVGGVHEDKDRCRYSMRRLYEDSLWSTGLDVEEVQMNSPDLPVHIHKT